MNYFVPLQTLLAPVAKLVDALDLGSSVLRCAGSSPVRRTKKKSNHFTFEWLDFLFWRLFGDITIVCFLYFHFLPTWPAMALR